MKNKNIKKYIGVGLLFTTLSAGLNIYDVNVDHTNEVCLISKFVNTISLNDDIPAGYSFHQIPAMENDFEEKGITDVDIFYGMIGKRNVTSSPSIYGEYKGLISVYNSDVFVENAERVEVLRNINNRLYMHNIFDIKDGKEIFNNMLC